MSAVEETRAWTRAKRLYDSDRFRRAYLRGARAALAGLPIDACPYRSRNGWAAWRAAWTAGWRSIP